MTPRIPLPRLLPTTIVALAALLTVKSVELVRAAVPADRIGVTLVAVAAEKEHTVSAATKPPVAPAAAPPSSSPPVPSAVSDAERSVLLELRQRRQDLDARETVLAARESTLAAAEQKLTSRVDELQSLQRRLETLEAARQQREDLGWQGLVKLYETMKPRDAAAILNELAMPTLLQIVDRMKEAKAALVLAAMNADKARDVTSQLAQMRVRRETTAENASGGATARAPIGTPAPPARTTPQGG
jgi:flagellar motility protein MotE (MotC chaperone)